jgi:hypothetical protein
MLQNKIVNAVNYNDFINPISAVKTDQGKTAFSVNEITQVLQAINRFSSDSLVSIVHRFIVSGSGGTSIPDGSIYGNYKEDQPAGKGGISPVLILGGLGLLFVMGGKKRK